MDLAQMQATVKESSGPLLANASEHASDVNQIQHVYWVLPTLVLGVVSVATSSQPDSIKHCHHLKHLNIKHESNALFGQTLYTSYRSIQYRIMIYSQISSSFFSKFSHQNSHRRQSNFNNQL